MPLIYQEILNNESILAIWKTEEVENQMIELAPLFKNQLEAIHQIKSESRRKEKLATLLLLKAMGINSFPVYDSNGKPSLNDSSKQISISHSLEYVALIASSSNCSIDIEINNERVKRIASKFLHSSEEMIVNEDLRKLQLIWSAKEVAYKLIPSKGIDFKEHMHVTSMNNKFLALDYSYLGINQKLSMHYELQENYQLVYAIS